MRRLWRGLVRVTQALAIVQVAVLFGAVYLLLSPPFTLVALLRGSGAGWRPVSEDVAPEELDHGV